MKKLLYAASGVTLLLFVFLLIIVLTEDKTGPVIIANATDITYTEGEDTNRLLTNVTAKDDRDGDVTDSLMVADILPMTNQLKAKVTFVAKDSSNNIAKEDVVVNYVALDGESIVAYQNDPLVAKETSGTNNTNANNENVNNSNSNNTSTLDTNTESTTSPKITLSENEVHLDNGTEIDMLSFVDTVTDDTDASYLLRSRIQIVGTYNLDQVGTYVIMYYTTDSDMNESNREYLALFVE
jgi:hypothetical protein